MKYTVFYLEYPDAKSKRKATRKSLGNHSGNCLAVIENSDDTDTWKDMIGPTFFHPNSDVTLSGTMWRGFPKETAGLMRYLAEQCLRISEAQARKIHPKLFTYLEQ